MPPIKKQHYVPQFYLRNFSADARALWVFDKVPKSPYGASITDIAAERFFYDVPPDSVASRDPQGVEKALSVMEGKYSLAIKELLDEVKETGRFTPGPTDRNQTIAHFLIIQDLRTKEFRDSFSSAVAELAAELQARHEFAQKRMAERGEVIRSENPVIPIPAEMTHLAHAQYMFNPPYIDRIVSIFLNHVWLIGDNQTGHHLYTSDAPVTFHSIMPNGFIGYGARGVEIAIPLSSRFMLVLFERSWLTQTTGLKDGAVLKFNKEFVRHYNDRQLRSSVRQVYCQENQFELATEVIGQFPEVCEPGRSRFSIRGKFE